MLTKSAAKTFFLGGTAITAAAFILLTLDTLKQFPERTNEAQLTEEVKHGMEIWTKNNCMGCHTLMGEGAYYAPELTKTVERRGEAWISAFLKDPESFYPGRRKMVKYDIFDPEKDPDAQKNIDAIIAFFAWVGKFDLNGFPPEPDPKLAPAAPAPVETASTQSAVKMPSTFATVCLGCHIFGGKGGNVGPDLSQVAARLSEDELRAMIVEPQKARPGSAMPNLGLPADTVTELVTFLSTAK